MDLEYIPLTDFTHDEIRARAGVPLRIGRSLADDLERLGLLQIRMVVQRANKMVPALGKVAPAGAELLSSASPVGQVSLSTTLHVPRHGAPKHQRRAR